MTMTSSLAGCGMMARPDARSEKPSEMEIRGLRALRRFGDRGLLHQRLLDRLKPGRPPTRRAAIVSLERRGFIEYHRAAGVQSRVQGAWRITNAGRAFVDTLDLPPAA